LHQAEFLKRIFDVIIAFLALLLLLPFFLIISGAIVFKDDFPVFYKQRRVGRYGKEFYIYKFRTMVKNSDKIGSHYTSSDDPRVTKVGQVLRKTSLDELPQLVNVLVGEMSLVGPRPNVMQQMKEYQQEDWNKRNQVRPGITGLAQISGRSALSFEQRLQYDLEYVDNYGGWVDIKILFLTVLQVLISKGVN
jgi:lipopolysaccharide/colanic/teichoic acid biosynthesis glycosyltransferase